MGPDSRELSPQNPNILQHSIAFKGHSTQVYRDAVEEIRILSEQGDFYPPVSLANQKRVTRERVSHDRRAPHTDKLTPAEAAAVTVLGHEVSALWQAFKAKEDIKQKLLDALKTNDEDTCYWILRGYEYFTDQLSYASGVRGRLFDGYDTPDTSDYDQRRNENSKKYWNLYAEPVKQDGLCLGEHTSTAILENDTEDTPETTRPTSSDSRLQK